MLGDHACMVWCRLQSEDEGGAGRGARGLASEDLQRPQSHRRRDGGAEGRNTRGWGEGMDFQVSADSNSAHFSRSCPHRFPYKDMFSAENPMLMVRHLTPPPLFSRSLHSTSTSLIETHDITHHRLCR